MSASDGAIVIVGGGLAGWTAAHWLRHFLPPQRAIRVIDIPVGDDPACINITAAATDFFAEQGILHANLLSVGASPFLATRYSCDSQQKDFYVPFAPTGFALHGVPFHQYAIWAKNNGLVASTGRYHYENFSLNAVAARLGNFRRASAQEQSIFSTLAHGYVCDTVALIAYLKKRSLARGVEVIEGTSVRVDRSASGNIDCLHVTAGFKASTTSTTSATSTSGCFYLDASGQQSVLMNEWPLATFRSAYSTLPVDCHVSVTRSIEIDSDITSGHSMHAVPLGWLIICTAASRQTVTLQFDTRYADLAQVIAYLTSQFTVAEHDCVVAPLRLGRRESIWVNNCVALGQAAGYFQDFFFSQLSIIQSGVSRLLTLLPGDGSQAELAREYNRLTHLEYDGVEEFHALHYRVLKGADNHYWQRANANELSTRLEYRLAVFRHTGHWPFYEGDPIMEDTWIALLLGAGRWPLHYDTRVKDADPDWIRAQLQKMYALIQRAAIAMPPARASLGGDAL